MQPVLSPLLTGISDDTVTYGRANVGLGGLSVVAAGRVSIRGTATTPLGNLTLVATGKIGVPSNGEATLTLGSLSAVSTGKVSINGIAVVPLSGFTVSSTGTAQDITTGVGIAGLGSLSVVGLGTLSVNGSTTFSLGNLTTTGVGTSYGQTRGTSIVSFNKFGVFGLGFVGDDIHGIGLIGFSGVNVTATGEAYGVASGTVGATLGGLTVTATGTVEDPEPVLGETTAVLGTLTVVGAAHIQQRISGNAPKVALGKIGFSGRGHIKTRVPEFVLPTPPEPGDPPTCGLPNNFPIPGDPDLSSTTLTVRAGFGGIAISWVYPAELPEAVAHTYIYRGTTNNFAGAKRIRTISGDYYFDPADIDIFAGVTYYYWIRMISVNGTEGSLTGPKWALLISTQDQILDLLTSKINDLQLSQDLKNSFVNLEDGTSQNAIDIAASVDADVELRQLYDEFGTQLDENGTAIYESNKTLTESNSALAIRVTAIGAQTDTTYAQRIGTEIYYADTKQALGFASDFNIANWGTSYAAVEQTTKVISGEDGIRALWMVKAEVEDVNGNRLISGIALDNDGLDSSFLVHAGTFGVGRPTATPSAPTAPVDIKYPFIITQDPQDNNKDIIALNAETIILGGSITNTMIGGIIKSDNFNPFSTGWAIDKSGNAIFHDVYVRGDVKATSLETAIIETKHIKGGAISAVHFEESGFPGQTQKTVTANNTTWMDTFNVSQHIPTGLKGSVLITVDASGQASGSDTNLGVEIAWKYQGASDNTLKIVHERDITVEESKSNGFSTTKVIENVHDRVQLRIYLRNTHTEGTIINARTTVSILTTLA